MNLLIRWFVEIKNLDPNSIGKSKGTSIFYFNIYKFYTSSFRKHRINFSFFVSQDYDAIHSPAKLILSLCPAY